jgi:hypothetical protein
LRLDVAEEATKQQQVDRSDDEHLWYALTFRYSHTESPGHLSARHYGGASAGGRHC